MNESFKGLTTLKLRSLKTGVTGQRGGENVNRLRGISCLECVQSISRVSIWITNDSMQICTIFQLVSHTFTIALVLETRRETQRNAQPATLIKLTPPIILYTKDKMDLNRLRRSLRDLQAMSFLLSFHKVYSFVLECGDWTLDSVQWIMLMLWEVVCVLLCVEWSCTSKFEYATRLWAALLCLISLNPTVIRNAIR